MKPEVRHVMTFPAGNQLPVAEKKVTIAVENGAGNDGGYRRNRVYYKGQKGNNEGLNVSFEPSSGDWNQNQMHGNGPYGNGPGSGPGTVSFMGPPNESPPRNQYPPHYHAPGSPSPMCGGSFHTAYPSSMKYYTASQPYSYAYTHQSNDSDSESYTYTTRSREPRPSSSFELFSDENPNACSVM
ncbi:heavy metal-associated isoprenylated plant protein [Trifolium repens]|nr:heavy metal-associated isoprenylated plant protein [Trifolium repens]